jgi:Cadherin domain
VFSESAYSFDVPENTARGARVGEVSASDLDEGTNGQVTYTVISDWANDVFSLNPQSGVFTLTSRLDYEEVSQKFPILAQKYKFLNFLSLQNLCVVPELDISYDPSKRSLEN